MNLTKDIARKISEKIFKPYKIEGIVVLRKVIDEIILAAKRNKDKEFVALFSGKIRNKVLKIDSLTYQRFESNHESAFIHLEAPMTTNIYGSVHSHPGYSNQPSNTDLEMFSKTGMIHAIICQPYSQESIAFYDKYGNRVYVLVKD